MFDLFRSREKSVRYLLGALLIIVALSMLTYLVPNYDTGMGAEDPVVAEIGSDKVTVREVQRAVQNVTRGQNIDANLLAVYLPQIIHSLVTDRAVAYQAERSSIRVSDADVAGAIRSAIPQLFQDGKFAGADVYSAVLAQQNLTISEFESSMRKQLLAKRLRDIALQGTFVSPTEVEQEFRRRNEKVKVEFVKVELAKVRQEVKVTPEEVRAMYERSKGQYQTPEKRSFDILVLDQAKLAAAIKMADSDLRRFYDQNKDRYRNAERVKVRHILLSTVGKSKDEEEKIRAKAEDLVKKIKGGADFAELAKNNSEDPGSASKGGDLDWVVRGQTVPEFEKTAFSLKPKEISNVIKTQYGFHILQVLEKEEARLKPFEEVKAEISAELNRQKISDDTQSAADRMHALLKKDPAHPEKVAAELGVELIHATKAGPTDPIPGLGPANEIHTAASMTPKGEVSQPAPLPGNKIAVLVVKEIIAPHQAAFEEVQEQVRNQFLQGRALEATKMKADELVKKANAEGGDLRKAAKAMGLEVKVSEDFTRQGSVEGVGIGGMFTDAFLKPVGTVIGPLNFPDFQVVAKLLSRTEPQLSELAAQREAIRSELKSKKLRDAATLFEESVRQQLTKEGKLKVHEEVVRRLTNSYAGRG